MLIHHQRKGNGAGGRAGDTLRGHSSIEASLDLALLIERENLSDTISIKSTKARGVDILPFSAVFTYENDQAGELHTAKFFGIAAEDMASNHAIQREIKDALTGSRLNKSELVKAVKEVMKDIGVNRIRDLIDRMETTGDVRVTTGPRTERFYSLP